MLDFKISIIPAETGKCRAFDSTFEYADFFTFTGGEFERGFWQLLKLDQQSGHLPGLCF